MAKRYVVSVNGNRASFQRFADAHTYYRSLVGYGPAKVTWQTLRALDSIRVGDVVFFHDHGQSTYAQGVK